jgi:hypothetical protein
MERCTISADSDMKRMRTRSAEWRWVSAATIAAAAKGDECRLGGEALGIT